MKLALSARLWMTTKMRAWKKLVKAKASGKLSAA